MRFGATLVQENGNHIFCQVYGKPATGESRCQFEDARFTSDIRATINAGLGFSHFAVQVSLF
jgi:hypothetical protein